MAVLLNNAGIATKGTALDGLDTWKKVIDVNLWGYVFPILPPFLQLLRPPSLRFRRVLTGRAFVVSFTCNKLLVRL